ncbi:hypothetical protein DE146DRAFT_220169 [Phaeosphaeria sp. MPI-PUGE-AT-0046c]|nr:hypothetical protein DE146DRAFT_220169 [Phaeosphaeria sp. MPI-PUGE-AT-0046c]
MADQAPFPADWALSRMVDIPARVYGQIYTQGEQNVHQHRAWMESKNTGLLHTANCQFLIDQAGYNAVPIIYRRVLHQTKIVARTVSDLARTTARLGLSMWAAAARLLVDYSVRILSSENLEIDKFLHGQRESIYWILDDALLRLCLDQWEVDEKRARWDKAVEPITMALSHAMESLQGWGECHAHEMAKFGEKAPFMARCLVAGYFKQTRLFLLESARVFEIERTIQLSGIGKLPLELADMIIDDVLEFEKVRLGHDLRMVYLSKGTEKTPG